MKAWKNLGIVETIYEEEYEFSSSASSSLSPSLSSPPTPLHSRVEKWSLVVGRKTDVWIRVQGKCFHLHKDPLISRSTHLKRQLTDSVTELTLSPPLNISAETFTLVAAFCYGAIPVITPSNLAALRTASELLEMTESDGDGEDSLVEITDAYFRQVVTVNSDFTAVVFRSALSLLPEAETTAFLVSRCVEAMNLTEEDGVSDGGPVDLFDDVMMTVRPEDFYIVAEAFQRRFNSHDFVYKIVDLYIRGHEGKITEEQKCQISSSVDCTKLTTKTLVEAVQNPAMPLRFIIRAMLVDHLDTRRRLHHHTPPPPPQHHQQAATLGSMLRHDAASRRLQSSLDSTALRVRALEAELAAMRRILAEGSVDIVSDVSRGRSASLRVESAERMVRKDDRLSASFSVGGGEERRSCSAGGGPGLSVRIFKGIKKAFRFGGKSRDVDRS